MWNVYSRVPIWMLRYFPILLGVFTNLVESPSELQLLQFWSSLQQRQCTEFSSCDHSAIGYTLLCSLWQSHRIPHWHGVNEVAPVIYWCKIKTARINEVQHRLTWKIGVIINCQTTSDARPHFKWNALYSILLNIPHKYSIVQPYMTFKNLYCITSTKIHI